MPKFLFIKRFTQWEYWPSYMFYIPNLPYAFYLAIKARNFTFYSAINPSIKNSGCGVESKYQTLDLIPDVYKPKSIFVPINRDFNRVIKSMHQEGIDYPIIVKPDIGFRGMLVEKIFSDKTLKTYLDVYPIELIIQEFIDLPNECGIFYYRLPNSKHGVVSSLTIKSFLSVQGDGVSTLEKLVAYDARAQHYTEKLAIDHKEKWFNIPDKGEIVLLSSIGNHSRGTQFINGNHLIDQELTTLIDSLNTKMNGWYYGRLDIKYQSLEDLKKGKNFVILEINGTISEPTHIYDPYHTTYFRALKTMRSHWKVIYQIAIINMKNGIKPNPFFEFWREVKDLMVYVKKVSKLIKRQS
jgi:hypothetical protein